MMRTDGTPVETAVNHTHITKEGDVQRDPDKEAPAPPPSLRAPASSFPADDSKCQMQAARRMSASCGPSRPPSRSRNTSRTPTRTVSPTRPAPQLTAHACGKPTSPPDARPELGQPN